MTVLGAFTLLGYALNLSFLVRPAPIGSFMVPLAASMFVLSGIALRLVAPPAASTARHRIGQALSLLVAVLGVAVVAEYLTDTDLGIDLLLFPDRTLAWSGIGRPALHAALAFTVFGLTMASLDVAPRHRHLPARILLPATALVTGVAVLGGVYGLEYVTSPTIGLAVTTTLGLVVLAAGILACRPEFPPTRLFSGQHASAVVARRMAPVGIGALLAGILVIVVGERHLHVEGLALTAAALLLIPTLYAVLWRTGAALDAADLRQRELVAALRDERDFTHTVLNSLREGVVTIAADGRVLQVNRCWSTTTGFAPEEIIGRKPPYPWFPPDNLPEWTARVYRALIGAHTGDIEVSVRRADGVYIPVLVKSSLIPGTADAPRMLVVSYQDLTEQRRAEADRRRAAEQLDAFFTASSDLLCILGKDGRFIRANPAWETTLGYPPEELVGQPFLDVIHPDDLSASANLGGESQDILRQIAQGESVARHSTIGRRKDGGVVHVDVTISPIRDNTGAVVGAAAITRDVTDRIAAERRFQRLVLTAPDAMVIADEKGTIELVNEQTEQLFGYPASELVGQPIEMLVPADRRGRHRDHRHRYLSRPEPRPMRAGLNPYGRRRDGTEFPVEITLAQLDTEHGTTVSAAIRDISERRQVERALADARDKALAAAELKSTFIATVSHEIRTPMNGVIGLTDLLLNTPLQPEQRRYVEAVRTSGRALLDIINDILDFSRIEAGRVNLAVADFDVGTLLEEVIEVAAKARRTTDLDIRCDYPPALACRLRGDSGRLRQVLLNLVGNAVKFTDHGEVVLRAELAPASDDRRPQIAFSVADTGIGIAPDALCHLFTPFSQVDSGTERQYGGTGLGLVISRQLIELMGGQLQVESQPGRGSRFYFTLPFTRPADWPAQRTGRRDRLAGRRMLLVDGNQARRQRLAGHVRAWGMATDVAARGGTALRRLRHAASAGTPYQVVVIDQQNTNGDGTGLAARIDADPTIPTIPLVVLTSTAPAPGAPAPTPGAAPGAAPGVPPRVGSVSTLVKPIGPAALYRFLASVLESTTDDAESAIGTRSDAATGHRQEPETDGRGLILLAEDNDINQMVAVETLSMLGYHTDVARDGIEAVELASTKSYQAILMDCQMPKMDGYTATAEVRHREPPHQHIPIIAMTAGAFAENRQRCLAAGMDDYLTKPIDAEQLRIVLDRWIDSTRNQTYLR